MHKLGHSICTTTGMKYDHFDAIQTRNVESMKYYQKEIEINKEKYKMCVDCGLVFHKMVLTSGTCKNCIEELLNRR